MYTRIVETENEEGVTEMEGKRVVTIILPQCRQKMKDESWKDGWKMPLLAASQIAPQVFLFCTLPQQLPLKTNTNLTDIKH